MPAHDDARPGRDEIVQRLRTAGCVFAEDEAEQVLATFADSAARERAVVRREGGAPLEHVLGHAVFDGLRVTVEAGVFVPRRRAEPLVDLALGALGSPAESACIVDLGCGSGAISAALAVRLPAASVLATDSDAAATACARRNGEEYGFAVHRGDWFDGLPVRYRGQVDVAVAYLPHVPTGLLDRLDPDFRRAEPVAAVHGGVDGLDPLRAVLDQAPPWLREGGALVTMTASQQAPAVSALAAERGWTLHPHPLDDDLFLVLRRPTGHSFRKCT
jgi:release factor glutamine methyltransferase